MNTIILQNGKTAIMNMEKMKEKGKKKEPLRNSYELVRKSKVNIVKKTSQNDSDFTDFLI